MHWIKLSCPVENFSSDLFQYIVNEYLYAKSVVNILCKLCIFIVIVFRGLLLELMILVNSFDQMKPHTTRQTFAQPYFNLSLQSEMFYTLLKYYFMNYQMFYFIHRQSEYRERGGGWGWGGGQGGVHYSCTEMNSRSFFIILFRSLYYTENPATDPGQVPLFNNSLLMYTILSYLKKKKQYFCDWSMPSMCIFGLGK